MVFVAANAVAAATPSFLLLMAMRVASAIAAAATTPAFFNSPAVQARLHSLAGPVAVQALALNTSGTYLGVSAGAAAGGFALTWLGIGSLPLIAAACAASALVLLAFARTPGAMPHIADGAR